VRFGPGGRGERREPYQGLVGDDGTAEFTRVGHGRMGSRAHAEGVVPALVRRGKEGPRARDPCAGCAGDEGGRESRGGCSPMMRSVGRLEMVRRPGFTGGGACGGGERV
jgi:hypothetical protein